MGTGECDEGSILQAKIETDWARMDNDTLAELKGKLSDYRQRLTRQALSSAYHAVVSKMKIEAHLSDLMKTSPLDLNTLLDSLSVLFAFLRQPISSVIVDVDVTTTTFLENLKRWIRYLAAELRRPVLHGPETRLFLLNHALRLPPGEAVWMANQVLGEYSRNVYLFGPSKPYLVLPRLIKTYT